jgi:hypothetical protein
VKVLTANRLGDGFVVWLGRGGEWSTDFRDAVHLDGEEADEALAAAVAQPRKLVGAYLIAIEDGGVVTQRERLREFIRAGGPSVGHSIGSAKAAY